MLLRNAVIRELFILPDHQFGAKQFINNGERSWDNNGLGRQEQHQRPDEHPEFAAVELFFPGYMRDLFIPGYK
jgi:hypothetical protein